MLSICIHHKFCGVLALLAQVRSAFLMNSSLSVQVATISTVTFTIYSTKELILSGCKSKSNLASIEHVALIALHASLYLFCSHFNWIVMGVHTGN